MKLNTLLALAATTFILAACGKEDKSEQVETVTQETPSTEQATKQDPLESVDQRLSYMVGVNVATQFLRDGIDFDVDAMILAIQDVKAGNESRVSEEQNRQTIQELQARVQAKQQAAYEAASAENKAAGEAYLAENSQKEGVMTTDSGLQYKEVVAGDGDTPTAADTVTVHYKGTLIDGTVFDSSYERGQPASFPVNGVIPGWIEALQLMNVGDKFELAIPSDLAYGSRGTGDVIGPDTTLLFEVELLEIVQPEVSAQEEQKPE
jgi:FKBP-type peptidyl-prolyl cis-trans isomerase